jgi:hypothetical protein
MHQTKPTTQSGHTNPEERSNILMFYNSTHSSRYLCSKTEPWKENRTDTHEESARSYRPIICWYEESIWEKFPKWVGWSDLLNTPWSDSLYFLYPLLFLISKIIASSQPTLRPSQACWANFDFSRRPSLRLCLCSRSRTANGLPVSPNSQGMP